MWIDRTSSAFKTSVIGLGATDNLCSNKGTRLEDKLERGDEDEEGRTPRTMFNGLF